VDVGSILEKVIVAGVDLVAIYFHTYAYHAAPTGENQHFSEISISTPAAAISKEYLG